MQLSTWLFRQGLPKCNHSSSYVLSLVSSTRLFLHLAGCGSGCQNGGACIGNVCNCLPGFLGPFCETINNCAPVTPCRNGGRCSSVGNTFVCDCTGTGFTGRDCSEAIVTNPCATNPCQNGAQCSWNGVLVTCACVGGFSGTFCQTPPGNTAHLSNEACFTLDCSSMRSHTL